MSERFRDELEELIEHCTGGVAGVTPSDFPLAQITQPQLDGLALPVERLADLYPLSPMQSGMLFHSLYDPQGSAYVNQLRIGISGLDLARFKAAWQAVFERHDTLRTGFLQGEQPFQWVARSVELPFIEKDWRQQPAQENALNELARNELAQGFDLATPPLMRLVLVRVSQDTYHFIWTRHHLLLDGWSTSRLISEVLSHYAGQPLPRQQGRYRDYIAWLQRRDENASATYWQNRLKPLEELTRLTAALKPARADSGYGHYRQILSAEDTACLSAFAQRERVTVNTLVQGAWALLLQCYTGQRVVTFGATSASRPPELPGVETLLGLFINTVPVVVESQPQSAAGPWLRELQSQNLASREHEYTPLFDIQRWVGTGGQALFDSIIVFENYPVDQALRQSVSADLVFDGSEAHEETNYPLTLIVTLGHTLTVEFAYQGEHFESVQIERLAAHYQAVLTALTERSEKAIGEIELLGEAERKQLQTWSINSTRYPGTESVHSLIERQVQASREATALIFGEEQLSYGELNVRANRLAHYLIALGVQPEVKVGIAVERSIEMVVGLLAILKAGGAYVPLDPEYPQERLGYMVEDSGIELLLTQSWLRDALPLIDTLQILELDTLDLSAESEHNPQVVIHGENLAYVIYTSGSTGQPKGAANRHRALHNRLQWMQDAYQLDESDTVLQKTPFSFDVSVWEFFWPLMVGARLALARPGDHRDPARLVELITTHHVTTLHFVPSMLQAFLGHEGIEACTGLRRVICSGEALSVDAQQAVFSRLPQAALYNLYGPTEAAIDVTHWTCCDDDQNSVPIGRPISGIKTWVLDKGLQSVPQGVTGELYLGGVGLARGYLQRAGLTAECFIADPQSNNGECLYRTGDRVRWNADGQLEYLGRIDHQVKIRGFRIELGEVEAQLLAQPEIREAVAVASEGSNGTRLVAYTCAAEGEAVDSALIREKLGQTLPDYMVPGVVVELDTLPLNANGKVDRKALPEPDVVSQQDYEPPQGEVEEKLASIWSEVLGIERVGRNDNFFELGGDSISALKVVARARHRGVQAILKQLFAGQTLADVTDLIDRQTLDESQDITIPGLPEGSRSRPLTASYAQIRQWFLWQLEPASTAYHISGALRLKGELDVDALQASFKALVTRHESLRTVFRGREDGQVEQVILDEDHLSFEATDLSTMAEAKRIQQMQGLAVSWHQRPFDLEHGPLLRIGLIREAADRHLLVVVMHHIISDGWSMQIIVDEFAAQYRARVQGEIPELAALPIQYADYAAWQHQWLEAGEKDRQLAYWRTQLGSEHPVLQLPADYPRRTDGRYTAAHHGITLPAELVSQLRERARAEEATLFMVLLTGLQTLLHRYSGQDDIRVGVPIANRHRVETEGVVGFFVNTQVLRTVVDTRSSLNSVLQQAKQAALGAQSHQDLPFEQLVEALQPERNLGTNPLFQVMYNHQRQDGRSLETLPGLSIEGYALGEQGAQFELTVDTSEASDGEVGVTFTYAKELFDAVTIERMVAHYQAMLTVLAEQPERAVGEIELLNEVEKKQLQKWGVNSTRYADAKPVHRLIERQVQADPTATALIFGDEHLSYADLNVRSNRLAHYLIGLGVKPEVKVGIAVERSIEMVVGLLAVLKAGGAYVPLDPEYPQERLRYMIEDSGIELLLTQSWLREVLPLTDALQVLELDTVDLSGESEHDPQVAVHGKNLAYVIYTSGSTGKPKGVGIPHNNLVEHAQLYTDIFELSSDDRMLQFATLNFDGCIEQLFPPLLAGAAMVLRGPTLWDSNTFHRELLAKRITVVDITTAYWLLLVQDFAHQGIRDYGVLRQLHIGGEAMPPEGIKAWCDAGLAHVKLLNTYGPTEATVTASSLDCYPYVSEQQALPAQMPIGTPLAGRILRVVDASFNVVPQGVAGELCIGGELLARGYLNRPDLSIERFVADPLDERGGRLYRTGDLVRWNGQGQLEYLGRIDHQVKIRGFRIELGEVEAQLLAQPEIREAVVVAKESSNTAHLVGYVSVVEDQVVDSALIRERLGQILPNYMVPSVIVELDKLPLNANGKVDRNALPEPDLVSQKVYEPPQGETEEALAKIWSEILDVDRIGRNDNFFELGGHSLLAIRLFGMMRSRINIDIGIRNIYAFPTLRELSACAVYDHKNINIVSLNTGNFSTPPLILIHDGQGSILDYTELARSLNNHCKVVALPCSHHDLEEYKSLYDLATAYANRIIRAGYSEPYRLCGWCVGGAIAPLVASVLESQGKRVDFVGAIDPYVFDSTENHSVDDVNTALLNFLGTLWLEPPKLEKYREIEIRKQIEQAALAPDKIPALLDELTSMLDDNQLRDRARLGGTELFELFMTGRALNRITGNRFESEPLRTPVVVWWSDQRRHSDRKRFADWLNLSVVEHNEIRADHYEMVRSSQVSQSIVYRLT